MNAFYETLGFVMAVSIGIMVLSVFYFLLSKIGRTKEVPSIVKLKGFFKNSNLVDVHLSGSRTLKRMKVIGVSDASSVKNGFPFDLTGMLVLEKENGKRLMIKTKLIQSIEETEDTPGEASV